MDSLQLVKKYNQKHPEIEIKGKEFNFSMFGSVDELKARAGAIESIIEHYESIIRNDFIKR